MVLAGAPAGFPSSRRSKFDVKMEPPNPKRRVNSAVKKANPPPIVSGRAQLEATAAVMARRRGSLLRGQRATPLHEACGSGDVSKVRTLLMSRADVNARDAAGSTAMHWAAGNGHVGALRALFGFGMGTEHKNNNACTPLHDACAMGKATCVQALLEAGANEEATTNDGKRPVDLARLAPLGTKDDTKKCVAILTHWLRKTKDEKEEAITRPVKWQRSAPERRPSVPSKVEVASQRETSDIPAGSAKIIFYLALIVFVFGAFAIKAKLERALFHAR